VKKLRIVTLGARDRSRGRFATPADFPLHDCSPYRGLHVRRTSLGFVPRSRTVFYRPVSNPNVTIRNFCFAVRHSTLSRPLASETAQVIERTPGVYDARVAVMRAGAYQIKLSAQAGGLPEGGGPGDDTAPPLPLTVGAADYASASSQVGFLPFLPRGDVRVSGRAHTASWVYRRRAHGPTLEYHQLPHGSSTHSLTHRLPLRASHPVQ
jgi:hypothetical protein